MVIALKEDALFDGECQTTKQDVQLKIKFVCKMRFSWNRLNFTLIDNQEKTQNDVILGLKSLISMETKIGFSMPSTWSRIKKFSLKPFVCYVVEQSRTTDDKTLKPSSSFSKPSSHLQCQS